MQLLALMGSYSHVLDWVGDSVEIGGITPNSDRVQPGPPGSTEGRGGGSRRMASRRPAGESALGSLYLRIRARRGEGLVLAEQQLGPPVQTRRRSGSLSTQTVPPHGLRLCFEVMDMDGYRVDRMLVETTASAGRRDPESREVCCPFGVDGTVREQVHR